MARKNLIIIIAVGVFLALIASNIILNVWFDTFDKYKFVEEWYKGILCLVGNVFLINYCVKKVSFYKNKEAAINLCSVQIEYVSSILDALKRKEKDGFIKSLASFSLQCSMTSAISPERQYIIDNSYCQELIKDSQSVLDEKDKFCFSSFYYNGAIQQIEEKCIAYIKFLEHLKNADYEKTV